MLNATRSGKHLFRALLVVLLILPHTLLADTNTLVLASTTSTENSGLLEHLLPRFTALSGIRVQVVAVGTGQALRMAQRGDADVLMVHHRPSEENFVAQGYGLRRHAVMHNDFVLVGPDADPAGIAGSSDFTSALEAIRAGKHRFVSRGDDSGTHKMELDLWAELEYVPTRTDADWYLESGSGQGATLNTAVQLGAYCLTDRSTWIRFANKADLQLLVEGDPRAMNPYGIILVNAARHPHVNARAGQAFIDWLTSRAGQEAIASYRVEGQQLFFPDVMDVRGGAGS